MINVAKTVIHKKKKTMANILYDLKSVPAIVPSGTNSKIEDIPGPKQIPKALTPTKIAE